MFSNLGQHNRAIEDHNHVVRLQPDDAEAHNLLAWLLATCADEKLRDGAKAVEHATRACKLTEWKSAEHLNTLAAAYAEAGQFESAIEWQTKTLKMVPKDNKADYQSRLDLYRARKAYHEPRTLEAKNQE